MKILVTSDLHLSEKIWKHRPIFGDSYNSWKQIVDIAQEYNVDLVILAGDVLDKQINYAPVIRELNAGLTQLGQIPVLFIQGQHDYQTTPWIKVANTKTQWLKADDSIELQNDWVVAGTDFLQEEDFKQFLSSDPVLTADILICHQVWKDFMGEVGKPQACFEEVPENIKLLITGDFHETICMKYKEMMVLSPGSTHLRSLSEPCDKSVFIVTLQNNANNDVTVETVPLNTRRLYRLDVTNNEDLSQIDAFLSDNQKYISKHELPPELHMPIMYITHKKNQTSLVQYCNEKFTDKAHLFYKVIKDNGESVVIDELNTGHRVTLKDCLSQYVDKEEDPEVYNLALAFLDNEDTALTLNKWLYGQLGESQDAN